MARDRNPEWWKRYLAGMAGGAAGTAAMGLYMKGMKSLKKQQGDGKPKEHNISLIGRKHREGEPATSAMARLAYQKITGDEPDERTTKRLGNLVHWGYGIDLGSAYGLVRGRKKRLDLLFGVIYGASLCVLGDELAVPLLGLAEGPKAYPKSLHVETLGAHIVYGVATAATTQLLERVV